MPSPQLYTSGTRVILDRRAKHLMRRPAERHMETLMRFAVCVTLKIKPGALEVFMPLMHANARASLKSEPQCHQFDVATDAARPNEVFLYEIYTDADAFAAHLETAHFKQFDTATADMIADKDVRTYAQVTA